MDPSSWRPRIEQLLRFRSNPDNLNATSGSEAAEFPRARDLDHADGASQNRHGSSLPPISPAGMPGGSVASFLSVESHEGSPYAAGRFGSCRRWTVPLVAFLILAPSLPAPVRGQQGGAIAAAPPATLSATPVATGSVRVSVDLVDPRGAIQPAGDAVVWLEGAAGGVPGAKGKVAAQVAQRQKTFDPHVEVVRVGSTVAFPNLDRIYHNVFSLSEIAPFDLGLYRNGASRSLVFSRPGVVRIYCNIHPDMAAFLVVVDSDSFGKTAADGSLELRDVPVGTWPVSVWHEKGGEGQGRVTVEVGRISQLNLRLDASRWRPLQHKNKYGKEYPPPDDEESRY
jgi:plastocyanin